MRRFKLDDEPVNAPARRFPLPQVERTAPEPQPHRESPRLQVASEREPYRYRERDKAQTQARNRPARGGTAQTTQTAAYTVKAPVPARKDRRQVGALLASDEWMPGPLGAIRLRIDRDSVDLSRVQHGNLPACMDHDVTRPFGRVTEASVGSGQLAIVIEVSDTPLGDEAWLSITERTRGGWSPAYYVKQAKILAAKDADYDAEDPFKLEVTKHMIVEGTLTSTPMNSFTRTLSISQGEKASMENAVVHDMVSMSYDVAKAVLRGDTGSEDQRERLRIYVATFDKAVAAGTDRFEAAIAARMAALA